MPQNASIFFQTWLTHEKIANDKWLFARATLKKKEKLLKMLI
jgi:hypothetical protein